MNKENEVVKVPFYGNEIVVVNKKNQKYVAMKPLVEGIGLDWKKQQELIKRDPVLSSVATITGVTGNDGKTYQMVCLPVHYINGWLFKVPASRYRGNKREAIIRYQLECYQALHDYFHRGAVVNSSINVEQINAVLTRLLEKLDGKDRIIRELKQKCRNRREIIFVCHHSRACGKHKAKKSKSCMQMVFDLFKGGK